MYTTSNRTELKKVDVLTGQFRVLTTGGSPAFPVWSPAGNLIAFDNGFGSIETIATDGSNRKVIIRADNRATYWSPQWSPAGGYLIYQRSSSSSTDIYRATSSGGSKSNLTGDIAEPVSPIAWR